MPQFMIKESLQVGAVTTIADGDAHHITNVLRLKPGDWIIISDNTGVRFKCEITTSNKKSVTLVVKEKLETPLFANITLAQALIKHDKFELIAQKAIELGVTEIIPYKSSRTIPQYSDETSTKKLIRWNKIVTEAAKQCGMATKPSVKQIISLEKLLQNTKDFEHKLFFYEGERSTTLRPGLPRPTRNDSQNHDKGHGRTIIVIGPEGGFSPTEVELAKKYGFTTVKLGPLILRVETAAITAVSLVQYLLGYFD